MSDRLTFDPIRMESRIRVVDALGSAHALQMQADDVIEEQEADGWELASMTLAATTTGLGNISYSLVLWFQRERPEAQS